MKSNKVETSTTWANLRIPQSDAIDSAQQDDEQLHSTRVSVRGFQKFLTSHHVGGTAIACTSNRFAGAVLIEKVYAKAIASSPMCT